MTTIAYTMWMAEIIRLAGSTPAIGAKFMIMLYATIDGIRSYSGEIYEEIDNDVLLIDQVEESEEVPFDEIRIELNKEMLFCSYKVLSKFLEV